MQSYGGFCAVTYLSLAPQGLKRVLLTGGIPPIGNGCTADTVYRACFEQVMLQNEKYYKRYPQDIEIVREVVNYLAESEGGGVRISHMILLFFLMQKAHAKSFQYSPPSLRSPSSLFFFSFSLFV